MTNEISNDSSRWHVNNIDFFDSHYDDKSILGDLIIEYAKKNIIFRDVHVFVNRAKNIASIKDDELVRNNLFIYLREQALI